MSKKIPLRARNGEIRAFALVDDEDYETLNQNRWSLNDDGYAVRVHRVNGRQRVVKMHRQILGLTRGDGLQGDHKNGKKKLDNRRTNLRVATNALNGQNRQKYPGSSRFRGVYWSKKDKKWQAQIGLNGKRTYLGQYDNEEEAGQAASLARLKMMPFAIETIPTEGECVAMSRSYKIRSFRNGVNKAGEAFVNYSVTIPTPIAELILEQFENQVEFEVELTDEGILYRPVEPRTDVPVKLPFAKGKRSDNGAAPPKPAAKKPGPKAKVAPKAPPKPGKPVARAKPGPKPKAPVKPVAKKPTPRAAKAAASPKPTVRKPAAKATTAKPAAPRPRAPKPKAKA